MNRVTPNLLNDTINLVQLARETALARGNKAQAERLGPVANNLLDLASTARAQPTMPRTASLQLPSAAASSPQGMAINAGVMGQPDFQTLLNALQTNRLPAVPQASRPEAAAERNQVVTAMASAGMADVEIARFMGITREEIRLILNVEANR
jgi:hypothetical protein